MKIKEINFKQLQAFEIPLDANLKSYLGFVRNEYNNNIGRKKYEEGIFLDRNTLKDVEINFSMRTDDTMLTLKNKKALVPRRCITVNVKNGIAKLKVNKNVEYNFDFTKMGLKDGIYTSVYIYFGKKVQVLIDKSKRHSAKKYISTKALKERKRVQINKVTKKAMKAIKRKTDLNNVKSEYILDIVKFMKELSEFNCAQKSKIVDLYNIFVESNRKFKNNHESQENVLNCYYEFKLEIMLEFKDVGIEHPKTFINLLR